MRTAKSAWRWVVLLAAGLLAGCAPQYEGRPLRHWLTRATSADYRERAEAEAVLAKVGPEALPVLLRAARLRDGGVGPWLRGLAVQLGLSHAPTVPPARVREQATVCLGRLGPRAEAAAPTLVDRLGDADPDVVRAAEGALSRIGPGAVPALVQGLEAPAPMVRRRAIALLGDREVFGGALEAAVEPLSRRFADPEPEVRVALASTLGSLAVTRPELKLMIVQALEDSAAVVRVAAARALGRLGRSVAHAAPALERRLDDPEPAVRVEAARALFEATGTVEGVVPVLVAALEEPEVHWQAALALGAMGPAAASAVPALLERLESEVAHRPARMPATASLALARMGAVATPGLVELLHHPEPSVRLGAVTALAGHGPGARSAVPRLIELLEEPELEARIAVVNTLGAIGLEATAALPDLVRLTRHADEYLRSAAVGALARVQPPGVSPPPTSAPVGDAGHDARSAGLPTTRVEAPRPPEPRAGDPAPGPST